MKDSFKFGFSGDQQQAEHYIKLLEQRMVALSYLLIVGYQALGVLLYAIRMYGPLGGSVLIDKAHYGIRARISTTAGCSTRREQPGGGRKWPSYVQTFVQCNAALPRFERALWALLPIGTSLCAVDHPFLRQQWLQP